MSHAAGQAGGGAPAVVARALVAVIAFALLAGACADSPEVPLGPDGQPDPVLVQGLAIYEQRCATCHGASGQGGRGKRINDGRTVEAYPDIDEMITVVAEGKGSGMPEFASKLEASEIHAVVRYVREVL